MRPSKMKQNDFKYLPIIFSTEMVMRILDETKTETRRPLNPQPKRCRHDLYDMAQWRFEPTKWIKDNDDLRCWYCEYCGNGMREIARPPYGLGMRCPYGKAGDHLYVRESFAELADGVVYKAILDGIKTETRQHIRWTTARFMPKVHSRIRLQVKDVGIERLHDINDDGLRAEGMKPAGISMLGHFRAGWNGMYRGTEFEWSGNPWVWKVKFKIIDMKDWSHLIEGARSYEGINN